MDTVRNVASVVVVAAAAYHLIEALRWWGDSPKRRRTVETHRAPAAIGPYSQAIRTTSNSAGEGGVLYCSGQIGLNPETKALVDGGVAEQTRQALTNLKHVLEEGGSSLAKVAKVTVLLVDIGDYKAVNEVYAEFFGESMPARAAFAVSALPAGALVEIDAIANA